MHNTAEIQTDLVFVGGGHAHALALRMLAMAPIEGLRITLVSPATHTPYSGMLPGLVAGHYSFEQTHIDLAKLCQWAGVRFICARVSALDPVKQLLSIEGRPLIEYDVLSIDVGSEPELDSVPGAREFSVPVKPVADLWQRWNTLRERVQDGAEYRIAMVGGGAGSVELIAAMAERFASDGQRGVRFSLYSGAGKILQAYNGRARKSTEQALADYAIDLHLGCRVERVEKSLLCMRDAKQHSFDELFWCTGAAAMPWIAASGLETDERGFLATTDTLQSVNYPSIFGTGDCATQVNHPRPKAGVYAVRQGPVLAENLRSYLLAKPLKNHKPQQKFLSLLSLGGKRATADRGVFSATGAWVWRWKDKIDREFMGRFEKLPAMNPGAPKDSVVQAQLSDKQQMPCGGCGAKVGADVVSAVLGELAQEYSVHCPLGEADDAVLIPGIAGKAVVQSIDTLRQIVADPWLMGRIAANHALSDLYASGANPVSALASISLPFSSPNILRRELKQLLAGALHEFSNVDCALMGGHSMQGPELGVGFVVNGTARADTARFLGKRGLVEADHLVLAKPLGTGSLFAAHMLQRADGRHVNTAIAMMLQSNARASQLAIEYQVAACTDVTGFGLAGHLMEMLEPGQAVKLRLSTLPVLPGVLDSLGAEIYSTAQEANLRAVGDCLEPRSSSKDSARWDLLFDPQTSGGLLMAISPGASVGLCKALKDAGYQDATVIGEVLETSSTDRRRIIVS